MNMNNEECIFILRQEQGYVRLNINAQNVSIDY